MYRTRFCVLLGTMLLAGAIHAQETYFSVPGSDAPELAARGPWPVGVRTLEIVNRNQPDILHFDQATGKAPLYDRPLKLEIWYPATIPPGQVERVVYEEIMQSAANPGPPKPFRSVGKALRDAPPVEGQRFPVVVVSHGYPGSRTFLSYLTENLASKGYVVAAIDHTDSVLGAIRAFPSTLLNRSNDQWFTIDTLETLSHTPGHFLNGLADASRVAIVGYSMGGYGALATAGAGYSKQGESARLVPGGYMQPFTAGDPKFEARRRDNLKALVAIAPWGAQPPHNNWDEQGLAGIKIPSLFIDGDQDDISGYADGVRKAFEGAVHSERYLLVYENARHNVGGNPAPPDAISITERGFFEEPVWRKDRICAINQHFITAFLDLHLKDMSARRDYLDLFEKSNEGKWTVTPGTPNTQIYSNGVDSSGNHYWKGFQRRWAVGLEWVHRSARK